jgi:hypothetical protein
MFSEGRAAHRRQMKAGHRIQWTNGTIKDNHLAKMRFPRKPSASPRALALSDMESCEHAPLTNTPLYSRHEIPAITNPSDAISLARPNRIIRSVRMKSDRRRLPADCQARKSRRTIAFWDQAEMPVCEDGEESSCGRMVEELCEPERPDSKIVPRLASMRSMWLCSGIHRAKWGDCQEAGDARDNGIRHWGKSSVSGHVAHMWLLALGSGNRRLARAALKEE